MPPHLVMDRRAGAPHGALARNLAVELEAVQLVAVERGDVLLGLACGHVLDPLHGEPQSLKEGARIRALMPVYLCRYAHAQTRRCAGTCVHTYANVNGEMCIRDRKRMLHGIVRATGDRPELLLVNSYGRIRQRDWWPGISDSGLESGPLSYGPTGYEEPLGLAGSKLRILRIRSGLNGEVPDWFTDEVAAVSYTHLLKAPRIAVLVHFERGISPAS